jgi:hypothetical protein
MNSVNTASPSWVGSARRWRTDERNHGLGAAVERGRHVDLAFVKLDLAQIARRKPASHFSRTSAAVLDAEAARWSTTRTFTG